MSGGRSKVLLAHAHSWVTFSAEVQVSRISCPGAQQFPHDLVGQRPSHDACLVEEHEVDAGLAVELEDLEYVNDLVHGLRAGSALEVHPIFSQRLGKKLEVVALKPCELRAAVVLEVPKGRHAVDVLVRMNITINELKRTPRIIAMVIEF